MGLDIGVLGTKKFLGTVNGQIFNHVNVLTTPVVAPGYPSAYLLVKMEPMASSTASLAKFSEAMSSSVSDCRLVSMRMAS